MIKKILAGLLIGLLCLSAALAEEAPGNPMLSASEDNDDDRVISLDPDDYDLPVTSFQLGLQEGGVVPDGYFDDAVFVGDSITLKLYHYVKDMRNQGTPCLGSAKFLTAGSLGSGNALWPVSKESVHPSYQGEKMRIEKAIELMGARKVYIMLGMNDVNRGAYEIKPEENDIADKKLDKRMEAVENYEKRLRKLTSLLLERGVKLTFVTPTIYDESTDPRALDKIGCDAGLEYLGEINRRVAAQTGSDFVNLHAPIRFLNAAHPMIRVDRVHPNEFGHVCMAHLFLAAQGLVDEPTALSVDSLPGWEELLPANRARYEAERKVRVYWNAEWLLLRDHPGTEEERRAYLKEFRKTAPNEFWTGLVDNYFALDGDVRPAQEQEIACVEACLKQ